MLLRTFLVLGLFALPAAASGMRPDGSLLVVVDAGHGGEKDGAVGPGKIREKDLALQICHKLKGVLEAAGHRVLLTRTEDETLKLGPRVKLANDQGADLFLSIHGNSMPTARKRARVHGLETYFLAANATDKQAALVASLENNDDEDAAPRRVATPVGAILADLQRTETHADSSRLAYSLHAHLLTGTGAQDRGVRQAPFYVLEGAAMPAVLLETGYVSHPEEVKRLSDPEEQEKIARSILAGVEEFRREVIEKRAAAGAIAGAAPDSTPAPAPDSTPAPAPGPAGSSPAPGANPVPPQPPAVGAAP